MSALLSNLPLLPLSVFVFFRECGSVLLTYASMDFLLQCLRNP